MAESSITPEELQAMRDDLVRARSSGRVRIQVADRQVVYRSVEEIDAAIQRIDESGMIPATPTLNPIRRLRRFASRTGW